MVNQAHGVPSHFSSQRGSLAQGNFNELSKEGTFWSLIYMNTYCGCRNLCVTWMGCGTEEIRLMDKWNSCEFKTQYVWINYNGKITCTFLGGKKS